MTAGARNIQGIGMTSARTRDRLVRRLAEGRLPAKRYTLAWDGCDEEGRGVPVGVYLLRLDTGQSQESRRLIRLK